MKKYLVGLLMVICALLIIFSAVYIITIMTAPGVDKIVLLKTNLTLEPGMSTSLEYVHFPENLPTPSVFWSSSNPEIISVDNGIISALQTGNATVRVHAGNVYAECNVTVLRSVLTVILTPSYVELELHDQIQLSARLQPADASFKSITWSSEDESVASVDSDGYVYANSPGITTVTAAAHNGIMGTCRVHVYIPVSELVFDEVELLLNLHESHTLLPQIYPENATKTELTWESENPDIVSVDSDGVLNALVGGTTSVRATAPSGVSAACRITVVQKAEKITLSDTELFLETGEIYKLTAEVFPETADIENMIWESSDPKVAQVESDGSVTALSPGVAIISIRLDEVAAACDVAVSTPEPFLKIQESLVLKNGDHLYPDLFLQNIRADELTYISSEPKVATVDRGGMIKALSVGATTITAKAPCGIASKCNVTVLTQTETVEYHFTGPSEKALSLTLEIPTELYKSFKNTPVNSVYFDTAYAQIIRDIRDDVFLSHAAKQFRALALSQGLSESELVSVLACFVQNLPADGYADSSATKSRPKFPVETLYERQGNDKDASLLLAALLDSLGFKTALVIFDDHMAVGICADIGLSGAYFPYMGKLFFYVEASMPGFAPGVMPERYCGTEAVLMLVSA